MLKLSFFFSAFLIVQTSIAQNTGVALSTGLVRYEIISPSSVDTGMQTLYFQPGKGAFTLISPIDSSGYRSIFDFEHDSVHHVLLNGAEFRVFDLKYSESLALSKKESPVKGKATKKTKQILGYECTQIVAQTMGSGKGIKIEGWVTPLIKTPIRPMMDETLIALGFPLEMSVTMLSKSKKPAMIYRAISIQPTVDPSIFVVPTHK